MPALKEVGRLSSIVGVSPLQESPMWDQDIAALSPIQFQAFVKRLSMQGKKDIAESAIAIALTEIDRVVKRGEISKPAILSYRPVQTRYMTYSEFKTGLEQLDPNRRSAVVFALEMKMDIIDVAGFRWDDLQQMQVDGALTDIAKECLRSSVRSISTPYVFWSNNGNKQSPLQGLEAELFDAFGLVWGELELIYKNIVMD